MSVKFLVPMQEFDNFCVESSQDSYGLTSVFLIGDVRFIVEDPWPNRWPKISEEGRAHFWIHGEDGFGYVGLSLGLDGYHIGSPFENEKLLALAIQYGWTPLKIPVEWEQYFSGYSEFLDKEYDFPRFGIRA